MRTFTSILIFCMLLAVLPASAAISIASGSPKTYAVESSTQVHTAGFDARFLKGLRQACMTTARKKVANGQLAGSQACGSWPEPTPSAILTALVARRLAS